VKYLVILCFALTAISAVAAEKPIFEIGAAPNLTLGRQHGNGTAQFATGLFLKVPVNEHWQAKISDNNLVGGSAEHRFNLGADYNFDQDWMSSYFVGAGLGWQQNRFDGFDDRGYLFGYAEAGKRFTLVHQWGLAYTPQVQLNWGERGHLDIEVMPLNLSVLF
jgi:hypothetical protein